MRMPDINVFYTVKEIVDYLFLWVHTFHKQYYYNKHKPKNSQNLSTSLRLAFGWLFHFMVFKSGYVCHKEVSLSRGYFCHNNDIKECGMFSCKWFMQLRKNLFQLPGNHNNYCWRLIMQGFGLYQNKWN